MPAQRPRSIPDANGRATVEAALGNADTDDDNDGVSDIDDLVTHLDSATMPASAI